MEQMPNPPTQARHTPLAPSKWLIVAAFAAVYFIWGSSYIGIRFAIETIPPFLMAGVRFILAGVILIAVSRTRLLGAPAPLPTRANWKAAFIAGALLFLGNNSMIVWSQKQGLPSGITAVLLATLPLWMVLLQWLVMGGKRPNSRTVIGMIMGMGGILLLVRPESLQGDVNPIVGLVTIGAALVWAMGSLYSRQAPLPQNPLLSTGMQLLAGGILLVMLSIISGDAAQLDLANIAPRSIAAMFYLMFFPSITGFTAFVWLIRVVPPERVATYGFVNPVIALMLGVILAGETFSTQALVGAGVIVFGVFLIVTDKLITRRSDRHRTSDRAPDDIPALEHPNPQPIAIGK